MICRHRLEHLRQPFVCRKYWTYLPICVCPLFERNVNLNLAENDAAHGRETSKAPLPEGVERVIVWTHHEEYGRPSNTGSLLPLGLEGTEMLMKGLDEHEERMEALLSREDVTPVVLWPGKGESDNRTTTVPDLRARVAKSSSYNTTGGIVLISIEGTWNNARKIVNRLPSHVLRLDLGEEIAANFSSPARNGGIFRTASASGTTSASPSLLAPLRRQGKGGHAENVSTVEATLVALLALGLRVQDGERILSIARTKIDRIRQYTGKGAWRP
ncbi:hypothetical protein ACHAXT_009555 [Thalassiosira profunda]